MPIMSGEAVGRGLLLLVDSGRRRWFLGSSRGMRTLMESRGSGGRAENVRTDSRGLHGFQRGLTAKPQLTWPRRGEREGDGKGCFVFGNSALEGRDCFWSIV